MNNKEILKKINDKDFSNNHKLYREIIDDIIYDELEFYKKLFKQRKYTANSAEGILKDIKNKWKIILEKCLYFDDICFDYLTNKYLLLIKDIIYCFKINLYYNNMEYKIFFDDYIHKFFIEDDLKRNSI